ncbi:unnamed protein product [Pieris macdunnoughi]|uniref:Uncharacterized protein n=1 Tax=Pieris macdunnoughi TaxID=345717 RepID=A0A821XWI1_9NEOP|nr:unnamed protein product [Pieris macdunnoughi]
MDLVDRLQLRISPASGGIFGEGGLKVAGLRGQVTLTFSSVQCSHPQITTSAIILDNVMGRHPLVKLPSEILDFTRSLNLADCTFHIPGQIDLLLGAEVLGMLRLSKSTLLQPGGLVAVTSDFGDVIMGPVFPIQSLTVEDGNLCVGLSLAEAIQWTSTLSSDISSPYIAIRTLLELAERERLQFPRAADVLTSDVFVDDICTGAANEKEALILRNELIGILKAGGYELRKWVSNSQAVLAGLPEDHQQDPYIFQNVDNPDAVAVLGIQYQQLADILFTFRVQDIHVIKSWTKRVVLSTVARIYDPNGWLAPVVFWAPGWLYQPESCWPHTKTELVEPLPGLRVISLVVGESVLKRAVAGLSRLPVA